MSDFAEHQARLRESLWIGPRDIASREALLEWSRRRRQAARKESNHQRPLRPEQNDSEES